MSDDPTKRRLRRAADKITRILILAGYDVYPLGEPFDLLADREDSSRRIKIVLGKASLEDTRSVLRCRIPPNTSREICRVTDDDRHFEFVRVR